MSIKSLVYLQCFHTQYALAFVSVLSVTYLSCCVGCLVSFVANLIAVSVISWYLTKRIRKRLNKEPITSFKRAVLVTGCDSGFGNALAFKLNENGYRVYATVLDPKSDGAQKLLTDSRFDGKTHVFKMDVTNDQEVQSVYEQVRDDLKRNDEELWAVVNNAGIVTFGPFDWGTIETYKQVFEVNTFGMVRVTRTFLPLLRQSKGRIVNLVSVTGRLTSLSPEPIYCMSKQAAISFSDAIRRELRKYGIRVSTVEPTSYKTPMTTQEFFARQVHRLWEQTSAEVKEVYGEDYLKNFKNKPGNSSLLIEQGDNIYEVVDALVNALRSPDPQTRYSVAPGCFSKFKVDLALLLPVEVFDMYAYIRQRKSFKPAYLRIEE